MASRLALSLILLGTAHGLKVGEKEAGLPPQPSSIALQIFMKGSAKAHQQHLKSNATTHELKAGSSLIQYSSQKDDTQSSISEEEWNKMKSHFDCDMVWAKGKEAANMRTAFNGLCNDKKHPEFKFLADARIQPGFEENHKKIYDHSGWLDEAYVAYFAVNRQAVTDQMTWLIKSVHYNSERPVIAVNFGDEDPNWDPKEFPRLVVLRARGMHYKQVNGVPFNFNKFRSMMLSKVRTGVMLDADEFVAPAADRLFARVAKEQDEHYPYVMLPVHWLSRDPDASFPEHGYKEYDFQCLRCPKRTQRWGHAHPTWTHHTLPFMGKWMTKVVNHEKIGDKNLGMIEDEDVLNIALWAEGAKKQWCKFDIPFENEFFKYLNGQTTVPEYPDPKWYPAGIPQAFYHAHHAVNIEETESIIAKFNAKGSEGSLPASLLQLGSGARMNQSIKQFHKMMSQSKWTEKNTEIKIPGPIYYQKQYFNTFEELKAKYPDVPCVL